MLPSWQAASPTFSLGGGVAGLPSSRGVGSSAYPTFGVGSATSVGAARQPWPAQQQQTPVATQDTTTVINQMIMAIMISLMTLIIDMMGQQRAMASASAPSSAGGMPSVGNTGAILPAQAPVDPAKASNLTIKGAKASAEQLQNARIIAEVGRSLGATQQEIAVAIATAIQESNLQNLSGGDRDSLGLFQQRPSMEWGSREQISNPRFAAESFFKGRGSNIGLLSTRNISDPFQRSHRVQRSAYPDEPRKWHQESLAITQMVV